MKQTVMKAGLALILILGMTSTVPAAQYLSQGYSLTFDFTGNVSSIVSFEAKTNNNDYAPTTSVTMPLESGTFDIARCILTTNLSNQVLTFGFEWDPLTHASVDSARIPYAMTFVVNDIPTVNYPADEPMKQHQIAVTLPQGSQTRTTEICTFRITPDMQSATQALAGDYAGTIKVNITEGAS